jgi:hypothetical protein
MLLIAKAALPVLVSVTACGVLAPPKIELPNPMIDRLRVATGSGERMPLPLSATVDITDGTAATCELPLSETIVNKADFEPSDAGVNVMFNVHVPPAGTLPQLPACR